MFSITCDDEPVLYSQTELTFLQLSTLSTEVTRGGGSYGSEVIDFKPEESVFASAAVTIMVDQIVAESQFSEFESLLETAYSQLDEGILFALSFDLN